MDGAKHQIFQAWIDRLQVDGRFDDVVSWVTMAIDDLVRSGHSALVAEFKQCVEDVLTGPVRYPTPSIELSESVKRLALRGSEIPTSSVPLGDTLASAYVSDLEEVWEILVEIHTTYFSVISPLLAGACVSIWTYVVDNRDMSVPPRRAYVRLLRSILSVSMEAQAVARDYLLRTRNRKRVRIWVTLESEIRHLFGPNIATLLNNSLALGQTPCHCVMLMVYSRDTRPQLHVPTVLDAGLSNPLFRSQRSAKGWGCTAPVTGAGVSEAVHRPLGSAELSDCQIRECGHIHV